MAVKIKDIAEEASVSTATVSLVLNNKPGISDSTRKKVFVAQKRLSRDLEKKKSFSETRTGTIRFLKIYRHGHVLSPDHESFVLRYIDGAEQEARTNGYSLEISTIHLDETADVINVLDEAQINGLVVLATELSNHDISLFEKINTPVVFIDAILMHSQFDFVDMNNVSSVHQVVKYFVENNHTKIGIIESPVEAKNLEIRSLEFPKALERFSIPYRKEFVYTIDSTFDGAYRDMLEILKMNPELPTALFSSNDLMAYAAIKAFTESGVRVPEDVSIIGFDDLPLCSVMEPQLTTIRISQREIGKMAVRLIIDRMSESIVAPSVQISVGGDLVERKSVKRI